MMAKGFVCDRSRSLSQFENCLNRKLCMWLDRVRIRLDGVDRHLRSRQKTQPSHQIHLPRTKRTPAIPNLQPYRTSQNKLCVLHFGKLTTYINRQFGIRRPILQHPTPIDDGEWHLHTNDQETVPTCNWTCLIAELLAYGAADVRLFTTFPRTSWSFLDKNGKIQPHQLYLPTALHLASGHTGASKCY